MDRRLGGPLPLQLANQTRVHLVPPEFFTLLHAKLCAYAVLAVVSNCYPPVQGRLPTRYSPVRHSVTKVFIPKKSVLSASFDLHVLSTPPAFILSQDQTLVKSVCSVRMTLAIHPLLLFWKSLASITRINNVRSENICLNFQGWLLFNYQCSFLFVALATAILLYHSYLALSTTFLAFFKKLCRLCHISVTACIYYHILYCLSTTFFKNFVVRLSFLSDNSYILTYALLFVNSFLNFF